MSKDTRPALDRSKVAAWVTFPDNAAKLNIIHVPGGAKGLFLRTVDTAAGAEIFDKAVDFGFSKLKAPGNLRILFPDGKIPLTAKALAEALGGKLFLLDKDELASDKWTINLSRRAPSVKEVVKPTAVEPDPDTFETIGLNARGNTVIRDKNGRFIRLGEGSSRYEFEGNGGAPAEFLRAARPEDLDRIAAGLVQMASRGTLHQREVDRVIDAALEEGPHGKLEMERDAVFEDIRKSMLRAISAVAIENEGARDRFVSAVRLGTSADYILSRKSDDVGLLSPSPAFLSFIRRAIRGSMAVDFRGSDDLRIAMPRRLEADADIQVLDFGDISVNDLPLIAGNALARRASEGRTILRLPLAADSDIAEHMRAELGCKYALEAVAEVNPVVADGVHGSTPSTVMFIGERRPEPLDALPQAAMRTFPVLTSDDLINLEREVLRSRLRIRDFHKGVSDAAVDEADDDREENARQKPYKALSRIAEPFTMIPAALEGASMKALARVGRDFAERGGVDAVVAAGLGQSIDGLGEILHSEQVDAVAMRKNAHERGRGFLLADQTGVGKGRALAAMALDHLRADPRNKVIYFTESAVINAPNVGIDFKEVGAWDEARPMFLTANTKMAETYFDEVTGEEAVREVTSPTAAQRKAILRSEAWPEDHRAIITTYSSFRSGPSHISTLWAAGALDEHTLIVLDESHNALNPKSAQGRNIRTMLEQVGPANVIFGTATPMRDPAGANLYRALLPQEAATDEGMAALLENMVSGGEVAQEAFATMIAEDGVMLRRDHDLSAVEFVTVMPSEEQIAGYHKIMNGYSPILQMMIENSHVIGEHVGRRRSRSYNEALANGIEAADARAMTNELNQYSVALGSPLASLGRILLNAMKVDQMVEEVLADIAEGRKPLVTFHSTNAALLNELARDENGVMSEEVMAAAGGLTLSDQIHRIHNGIYKIRIEGETRDAREVYPEVGHNAALVSNMIDDLADNLPVSPIDALVERLEQCGLTVGEISGRTLCYRDNRISRRTGRDRLETIDGFNNGQIDVMLYNGAGATGGNFQAGKHMLDQRPRSINQWEAPLDPLKYLQGIGRVNRYGQVNTPRIKAVLTGLVAEMRFQQMLNRKLRSVGASVDGNRDNPFVLEELPDLLNKVGDEATRNVLMSLPSMARRLGFSEIANNTAEEVGPGAVGRDTGVGYVAEVDALANKALARAIVLFAHEQEELTQRIRMEFDALIEELDSRNANPLRPKSLKGQVEVKATSIYSGQEIEDEDLDTSAFLSPLYMSTAVHHFNAEAWSGEQLVEAVEACRRLYGVDGFQPFAERLRQRMPEMMRPFLPEGVSMENALANPAGVSDRFRIRHERMSHLGGMLEQIRPGVTVQFPTEADPFGLERQTVVDLIPPQNPIYFDLPSAYKIRTISPGMDAPETTSLSRLMPLEDIRFTSGIADGYDEEYLNRFDRDAVLTRKLPVQILSGNILQAISEAEKHDLGTVSLYRDKDDHIHRGIVVNSRKVDMDKLPVTINSSAVAAETVYQSLTKPVEDENKGNFLRFWGGVTGEKGMGERSDAELQMTVTARTFTLDMIPLRKKTRYFWARRPGLYELMYERPLPSADETPEKAYRRSKTSKHVCKFKLEDDTSRERALRIIEALSVPLMTDGLHRPIINEATNRLLKGEERSKFIEIEDDPILETASEEATEDDIFTPSGEYDFEGAEFDGDEEFADISWS